MILLFFSYSFSVYVHHFRHYYPIYSQTSLKRKSLFISSLKPLNLTSTAANSISPIFGQRVKVQCNITITASSALPPQQVLSPQC